MSDALFSADSSGEEKFAGSAKHLLSSLLYFFDGTEKSGTSHARFSSLQHLFVQSQVRVLIVDEAESLCPEYYDLLHCLSEQTGYQILVGERNILNPNLEEDV